MRHPWFVWPSFIIGQCIAVLGLRAADPATEIQYLSGHGPKDAVPWNFTVTGGRRAGEAATIPVPSNWELQGFGTYNYGQEMEHKADEHGHYRVNFSVPGEWKGRTIRLVFDGVMTDAAVKVNGRSAGPTHIGAFYRFKYDVTSLVKLGGDNVLEVDVAKVSSDPDTEKGERFADYWVFGGIFRPVYLEAEPAEAIEHAAIEAQASGALSVEVTLGRVRDADRVVGQVMTREGQAVGAPFEAAIPLGGTGSLRLATMIAQPKLWSAETPNLYDLHLSLRRGADTLHALTERFGFRTFEVRAGQGLFLNGQRILLKGVDRHSFRPETGRALNPEDCYDDVRTIRQMNLNAARMSHYPPDAAFLAACDELGLYVLDELSGWHHFHSTEVGRRLVREMVERDVNHPSILFWDNGNEGGFNRDLDGEFARYDPSRRPVLHPWEAFNGVDTKHYPSYDDLTKRLQGPSIVMPTEFLHALYDGGAGAGLEDYWRALSQSRFGGGGFIWMFADEGVVRTDQGGRIDVFSTFDPDGILGPHHEKEGSFYAIRDIYSPVQIDRPVLDAAFAGALAVHNAYDFTSLKSCRFFWELLRYPSPADRNRAPYVVGYGEAAAPEIAPHAGGTLHLSLPDNWREADALAVAAFGSDQTPDLPILAAPLGRDGQPAPDLHRAYAALGPDTPGLWTWIWPTPSLGDRLAATTPPAGLPAPTVAAVGDAIELRAGTVTATLDAASGLLRGVRRGALTFALANGPRLTYARPESAGPVARLPLQRVAGADLTYRVDQPATASVLDLDVAEAKAVAWVGFKLELSGDGRAWSTIFDSSRRGGDGFHFVFPPQTVAAVRLSNLRSNTGQVMTVSGVRLGHAAARFPDESPSSPPLITQGVGAGPAGDPVAWVESHGGGGIDQFRWRLHADGVLELQYHYALEGTFEYHGVTFDQPESEIAAVRWLGEGPYRVWQNRLRGTSLGVHEIARHELQPGESWDYPEFQGYFAGLRWAQFATTAGPFTVRSLNPDLYLRIGTPRISHPFTTPDFPAGELSFLAAISPIGSKFKTPRDSGPASQWAEAAGGYDGDLFFRFGD
jgi:hypothetical protein